MLVALFHFVTSFILRLARARSCVGVFCVFLMSPCSTTSIRSEIPPVTSRYACCAFSFRNLLHSPSRQGQVMRRRFLRFLDEPVQHDEHLVVTAQDQPGR